MLAAKELFYRSTASRQFDLYLITAGMLKFSATTEEAEAALHEELVLAKMEMSPEEQKSSVVVEALMTNLMQHPYDLRGRRHLLTVLELYKVG